MFNSDSIYLLMLASGFLGGFGHCIGMCGPIVGSYCVLMEDRRFLPHLLYNYGRITTYVLLGGLLGYSGAFLGTVQTLQVFQKAVMIIAGVVIILMGLGLGGWLPFLQPLIGGSGGGRFTTLFSGWVKNIFSGKLPVAAFYPMGIVLGFIPCGLVYTALITTARAAMEAENELTGLLQGGLLMLLFGLGTLPALLLVGRFINIISLKMRENLYKLSAVFMVIMGIIFLVNGIKSIN
ncbi:MAG: sulfite exporter TauE/SafE family protein [Thermodesulfobacteriota bacterium]